MTNSLTSNEREQRLKQIRERQAERAEWAYGKDIAFLLSLLDNFENRRAGETILSKEKDQTTAYELVRDYGGSDNTGLLRRKIEAALTTARQEERAAAFKEARERIEAVNPSLTYGSANGSMMKKCILAEIAALEAAANEPQANKVEPER